MFFCGVSCLVFMILLISSKQFNPQSQFICNGKILEQVVKCKSMNGVTMVACSLCYTTKGLELWDGTV